MACPVCPTAGWLGGWIGGYFGIYPPETTRGKILSATITASLACITIVALKVIFNITLCVGGTFTLGNVARVAVIALPLGIVYSVLVNCLLKRYVYAPSVQNNAEDPKVDNPLDQNQEQPSCCCAKNPK